jgi:acetyl-CoA carboxylase biotin carboxylase subunit
VLEESPSPAGTPELRKKMGDIAVTAVKAAGYANAGTVEFLADNSGNFYFLEMNTRLQVEHPVTELVTGLDLVQLQIRIASGEKLPFTQDEVKFRGHAIECRIYAEDPENNYFPSPGTITKLAEPSGPGIRLDSGIYEGWNVPLEYDPLLAKLIGYGESREHAIGRVQRALGEYLIAGVKTNLPLFRRILKDADFLAGNTHTGLLDRMPEQLGTPQTDDDSIVAIAAGIFSATIAAQAPPDTNNDGAFTSQSSAWKKIARTEALS